MTLVDEATNQSREQRTNEEGFFEFRTLRFGTYRIEAERPGFKKEVIGNVALEVAQTAVVNIALQVGTRHESIGVHADRVLLETSDASLSQVIDDTRLARSAAQRPQLHAARFSLGRCDQCRPGQCHSTPGELRSVVLGRRPETTRPWSWSTAWKSAARSSITIR